MDKFMEDFEKMNVELSEQSKEIKKLMQDKIDLLERLVKLYEQINDRPFFLAEGTYPIISNSSGGR